MVDEDRAIFPFWKDEKKIQYDKDKSDAVEKRRILVHEYMLAGCSQLEIIKRLREEHNIITTQATVSKDSSLFHDDYKYRMMKDYDAHRALDLARLESMIGALWASASTGSINSIKTIVVLLERKSKMLGLDEPAKIDIRSAIVKMAQDVNQDPQIWLEAADLVLGKEEMS